MLEVDDELEELFLSLLQGMSGQHEVQDEVIGHIDVRDEVSLAQPLVMLYSSVHNVEQLDFEHRPLNDLDLFMIWDHICDETKDVLT